MRASTWIILGLCLIASVAAQLPADQADHNDLEPRPTYTTNECHKAAMKNYLLATDAEDTKQESYIRAAEAYLQLEKHGQPCA